MTTKRQIAGSLAAAALAAAFVSGLARADLTAKVGATSNYVWRGATQTDDNAAISGGIDWSDKSGFYLGTWVSNVRFGSSASGEIEWNFYGGSAGTVGNFCYDSGVIY